MKQLKKLLKQLLPSGIIKKLLPAFHLLQAMAASALFLFPARKMKVIGITGTNGKTTSVSYMASILEAAGYKIGVSSTTFYQIGDKKIQNKANRTVADPFKLNKLLFKMRLARVDYVVMEVTSHSLAQNRLWGVPILAAGMTNLTQDHMDYHKTMDNYAAAKAKLFKMKPDYIALNADDSWFDYYNEHQAEDHKMSYGAENEADTAITKAKLSGGGSVFTLTFDKTTTVEFKTQLVGKFNVYNAALAATLAYLLHIPKSSIVKGIHGLESVPGRMEPVPNTRPYDVIIDFAHTPDGLEKVLETLQNLTKERLILVFGGTGNRDKERQIMGEIAAKLADRIILTEDEIYYKDPAFLRADVLKGITRGKGASKTQEVPHRREGIKKALQIAKKGDTVVITGMGDQEFTRVGDEYVPWNDKRTTLELLEELDSPQK